MYGDEIHRGRGALEVPDNQDILVEDIRKMTRKHIENTIGMLENKSVISVNKLNEYSNKNEQIMECIKLLERKIEEFIRTYPHPA